MRKKLLVFGGSGHAKDVIEVARSVGYGYFQIITTDGSCAMEKLEALKESDFNVEDYKEWDCIVAIGNNAHRRKFYQTYKTLNFVSIISPTASISSTASIAKGSYVGAFAYLGPDSKIGEASIINSHSIIGHDAIVGEFSHIGPKVCLSGHVELGKSVFVGAGANINNGSYDKPLQIPDDVHIGMGCLVTESIKYSAARLIPKPNYIIIKT